MVPMEEKILQKEQPGEPGLCFQRKSCKERNITMKVNSGNNVIPKTLEDSPN